MPVFRRSSSLLTRPARGWIAFACLAIGCGKPQASKIGVPDEVAASSRAALSSQEAAVLAKEGLVITDKTAQSFHVGYTSLFREHQPVFVSADAVLSAWHASFSSIYGALEEHSLGNLQIEWLSLLRENLQRAPRTDPEARADLDVIFAVGLSLAEGKLADPIAGGSHDLIKRLTSKVQAGVGKGEIKLFGRADPIDFSRFSPRGFYDSSEALQRYFHAHTWLRTVEFRLAVDNNNRWVVERRSLRAARLFLSLLSSGNAEERWRVLDDLQTLRRGPSLALQIPELQTIEKELGADWDRASDPVLVSALQAALPARLGLGGLGNEARSRLSFMLFGPRDSFDAATLSALGEAREDMPKSLDLAATTLGNDTAKRLLDGELKTLPGSYADTLERYRVRAADAGPTLWTSSLHHRHIHALRTLSPDPQRDQELPEPLRGEAWALRLLNTQLASWAELRHDRVSLPTPAQRGIAACEYPDAYVDPYPALYFRLEEMATKTREQLKKMNFSSPTKGEVMDFLDRFSVVMSKLRALAEKERANQPFSELDLEFINRMVSIDGKTGGCTLDLEPKGWLADLYFDAREIWGAPTMTDVYVQSYDAEGNRLGKILHVATSAPKMFAVTIAHDAGKNTQTYRGFVSSYSEEITSDFTRYDDEVWLERLQKGERAKPPSWLKRVMVK